jgi:LmbE family N-acetylglucosaminyl deacetylase
MHSNPTSIPAHLPVRGPLGPLDPNRLAGATLLAVWAHPDDEAYLGGGLMASVAASGGRVVNVTATLGEHGTPDPVIMPPARLASIRRRELGSALEALGVDESVVLGYEDGSLESVSPDMGARRIASVIDEVSPDVVISFGPDGVTGHPDHIAVGEWVRRALDARVDAPALLQTAVGRFTPPDIAVTMDRLGAFFPGYAPEPARETDVLLLLDDRTVDTKLRALAAHASQTEPVRALLGDDDYRRLAAVEAYHPANARAWAAFTAAVPVTAA